MRTSFHVHESATELELPSPAPRAPPRENHAARALGTPLPGVGYNHVLYLGILDCPLLDLASLGDADVHRECGLHTDHRGASSRFSQCPGNQLLVRSFATVFAHNVRGNCRWCELG